MRTSDILAMVFATCLSIVHGQSNLGVYIYGEGGLIPGRRTDIHDLANSLTDSSLVVEVDSTKGGGFGVGMLLIVNDWTVDLSMSTVPTYIIGNGDFSAKYTTLSNNTSIKTDSLDLFMMYSHFKVGIGRMFHGDGPLFVAPSLNYDSEAGRMVVKDDLWRRYDHNNHFTYTTTHNGVHIDSLHQDKSKIRGVSLGLRTGMLIGRGWEKPGGFIVSVAPVIKYGWRTNTNLFSPRTTGPGRWSFYATFCIGIGLFREDP